MRMWDQNDNSVGTALLVLDTITGHRSPPTLDLKTRVRGHLVSTVGIPTKYVTAGRATFVSAVFRRRGGDVKWGAPVKQIFSIKQHRAEAAHVRLVKAFGGAVEQAVQS